MRCVIKGLHCSPLSKLLGLDVYKRGECGDIVKEGVAIYGAAGQEFQLTEPTVIIGHV